MEFYREVRTRPWTRAFRYAAVFFVLISFCLVVVSVAPEAFGFLDSVKATLNEQVPNGTTFEIKDGKFVTNLEPATEFGNDSSFVVVDATMLGKDFPKAFDDRVGMFIGRDAIFTQEPDGSREIIPLDEIMEITTTKEQMIEWLAWWGVVIVLVLLWLAWMVAYSVSLVSAFIYISFMSLVALMASRIWKLRLNYSQWLAVGFHAITLPTILDHMFSWFGLDMPFLMPVVFFMFVFAVLADEKASPVKLKPSKTASEKTK